MAKVNDIEPVDNKDDEIGVAREINKNNRPIGNTFIYLLIVIFLVVGSFWGSFYIGKALLSPNKELQETEFEKLDQQFLYETSPNISTKEISSFVLTKESESTPTNEVVNNIENKTSSIETTPKNPFSTKTQPIVVTPKNVEKKIKSGEKMRSSSISDRTVYIVRSNKIFENKDDAAQLFQKAVSDGFECFVKELGPQKYVIQFGVFKNKLNADDLVKELNQRGYSTTIIKQN